MQGEGGGETWDRKDTCSFPGRLSHWLPLRDRLAKGYARQRHMGEKFKRDPEQVAGSRGGWQGSLDKEGLPLGASPAALPSPSVELSCLRPALQGSGGACGRLHGFPSVSDTWVGSGPASEGWAIL